MAALILAVDLGTSGCKCALVTLDGRVLGWAFRAVALHIDGVSAEQDPRDWWEAFLQAACELLSRDPSWRAQVAAVCCSTQGEGTIAVDATGEPLGRAIVWLDMRGAASIAPRVRALSGKSSAGHITSLRDCKPAVYEQTFKFLNVLDYMNLRLTGRFCATPDSILTSWVTDNRNAAAVRYDASLMTLLGIDADKLPEIVRSTEVIGTLRPHVAGLLGLQSSTRVVGGAIDNSAVAIGACTVRDFETHLYMGTSSWLGAHVPFKKTDIHNKIASIPCALSGRYLATAMQSAGGANLSFLRDRVLFHADELLGDELRPDVYETLDRIAQRVPAGARGLLYTPW